MSFAVEEARLHALKRELLFEAGDAELVRAFCRIAGPEFPRIAREFLERVREHADTSRFCADERQLGGFHLPLVSWLRRICGGLYDGGDYAEARRVGRANVSVGLPQSYLVVAMGFFRVELSRAAHATLGESAGATRDALLRILDLELVAMTDAYEASFVEETDRAEPLQTPLGDAKPRYTGDSEFACLLVVGLDADRRIKLFNREAERVTGFAQGEVIGRDFASVFGVQHWLEGSLTLSMGSPAAGATSCVYEGTVRNRQGQLHDVTWNVALVRQQTDAGIVVLAVGSDATGDRALAERARRADRLADVAKLASGLAHEIHNPLTSARLHVMVVAGAIANKAHEQDVLELARMAAVDVQRLADLLTKFLEFVRPKPLCKDWVSLFEVCRAVVALALPQADCADVALVCELPSEDVAFGADAGRLIQALSNLVRNAIEAAGAREGRRVVINGRREPQQIVIDVKDDGGGLPIPFLRIFDAFFSTKQGSVGLGLSVARRIVSEHHGTIDASSNDGTTTFRLTLPLESPMESAS